jgi:hypothetical protein
VSTRSFWPPNEAAKVDYETLRAHALEPCGLPKGLAAARFARRGLAGLIAWAGRRAGVRRRAQSVQAPYFAASATVRVQDVPGVLLRQPYPGEHEIMARIWILRGRIRRIRVVKFYGRVPSRVPPIMQRGRKIHNVCSRDKWAAAAPEVLSSLQMYCAPAYYPVALT